jgi:hypothetical protein
MEDNTMDKKDSTTESTEHVEKTRDSLLNR